MQDPNAIKMTHYVAPAGHPVKTRKIENHDVESGYVVINEEDFDADKHKEFHPHKAEKKADVKEEPVAQKAK